MSFSVAIPLIGKVLDRVLPDPKAKDEAKIRLIELAQTTDLVELDAELKLALGQIEVNKTEAQSSHWWVAGWRPAVGWICALGVGWNFVMQPLAMWVGAFHDPVISVPSLDISQLMVLLLGMLGIGGMRSFDKAHGRDTKAIN